MNWPLYLSDMAPYLATAVVIIALIVVVNRHGRRLARHESWALVLALRIDNLHKERRGNHCRELRLPHETETIEVDESWILTKEEKKERGE